MRAQQSSTVVRMIDQQKDQQQQSSQSNDSLQLGKHARKDVARLVARLANLQCEVKNNAQFEYNLAEESYAVTLKIILSFLEDGARGSIVAKYYEEASNFCKIIAEFVAGSEKGQSAMGWLSDSALWMRMAVAETYRTFGTHHEKSRELKRCYEKVLDELWQLGWLSDGSSLVGCKADDYKKLVHCDAAEQARLSNGSMVQSVDLHQFAEASLVHLGRRCANIDVARRSLHIALAKSGLAVSDEEAERFLKERGLVNNSD